MNASVRSGVPSPTEPLISDGEVDFLWWFIQGSLMDADVRARLHAHWGLCRRHSLAFFTVESSFRPHLIHGCTILYAELMQRALRFLSDEGLHCLVPERLALHFLRTSGPCHVCALGYGPATVGNAPPERLAQGRDLTNAIGFAAANSGGWQPYVCGMCAGNDAPALCRPHLIESMEKEGRGKLGEQRERIQMITSHMERFDNSFRWEQRGTDTAEDRGALIAAIGWCSGWESLLAHPLRELYTRGGSRTPTCVHGASQPGSRRT